MGGESSGPSSSPPCRLTSLEPRYLPPHPGETESLEDAWKPQQMTVNALAQRTPVEDRFGRGWLVRRRGDRRRIGLGYLGFEPYLLTERCQATPRFVRAPAATPMLGCQGPSAWPLSSTASSPDCSKNKGTSFVPKDRGSRNLVVEWKDWTLQLDDAD
jgi:hypothetical protein